LGDSFFFDVKFAKFFGGGCAYYYTVNEDVAGLSLDLLRFFFRRFKLIQCILDLLDFLLFCLGFRRNE
jgi:hypothetical protein